MVEQENGREFSRPYFYAARSSSSGGRRIGVDLVEAGLVYASKLGVSRGPSAASWIGSVRAIAPTIISVFNFTPTPAGNLIKRGIRHFHGGRRHRDGQECGCCQYSS
jgi:hypothetical protein